MSETPAAPIHHLVIVLGDQLDHNSTAFDGFDPAQDVVWMAEVAEESTHVWSAKPRTAIFLSAMRHFAAELRERGLPLRYTRLQDADNTGTLAGELQRAIADLRPARSGILTAPGDWRVLQALRAVAAQAAVCRWSCATTRTSSAPCASSPPTPGPQAAAPRILVPRAAAEARRADGRPATRQAASGTSTPTTARASARSARRTCRRRSLSSPMRSHAR